MEVHRKEVANIAEQVKKIDERKEKFRIFHGSTNSTRPTHEGAFVDTSRLTNVIAIDKTQQIAIVEANVPMDGLLEETLKYDMVPLVVTEFPGITIGGAFSGTAGESSSFKHGFFDRTASEVEMVLADGEIVTCSDTDHADLFKGATGALGTLGVVTLLHVRLQKATNYVEVTYHPISSVADTVKLLKDLATTQDNDIEFLDGIMFSPTEAAILTGRLVHDSPKHLPIQRFSRAKDPWFYLHTYAKVFGSSNTGKTHTELIPLPDYIFHYNRGCFWCGATIFDLTGLPFNNFTRRAMDNLLNTRALYTCLHAQKPNSLLIIQDLAIPFNKAEAFLFWVKDRFGIYPLWLCPLKTTPMPTLHPHPLNTTAPADPEPMLNIGIYGVSPCDYEAWISANQDLETRVSLLGGMKWSYASQFYDEEDFWSQHDRGWYDALREKYRAESLPTIYEKTRVDVQAGKNMLAEMMREYEGSLAERLGATNVAHGGMSIWTALCSKAWKGERAVAWRKWPRK